MSAVEQPAAHARAGRLLLDEPVEAAASRSLAASQLGSDSSVRPSRASITRALLHRPRPGSPRRRTPTRARRRDGGSRRARAGRRNRRDEAPRRRQAGSAAASRPIGGSSRRSTGAARTRAPRGAAGPRHGRRDLVELARGGRGPRPRRAPSGRRSRPRRAARGPAPVAAGVPSSGSSRERPLAPLAEVQVAGGRQDGRRLVLLERTLRRSAADRAPDVDQRPGQRSVALGAYAWTARRRRPRSASRRGSTA